MKYPEFLKKNDLIGISAPSAGVGRKLEDYQKSIDHLHACGYQTYETASVRLNDMRGGDAETRGKELTSLFADDNVKMVMAAAGGDFLMECLPYVDFETMQKNPKWLMGASDPTGILYPYTVKYDVATIYGSNAGSFSDDPVPDFILANLEILKGNLVPQRSYPEYMSKPGFMVDHLEYDSVVEWKSNEDEIHTEGRCIGGCIECLKDLIGTEYDGTTDFIEKYKDDGFIWYFDNFSMPAEAFYRTLLQFKFAGWFRYTKAVIIGRTLFESNDTGMSYEDGILTVFDDIPVIYQADVGHTKPNMTMINGAMLKLDYKDHKGLLQFTLK